MDDRTAATGGFLLAGVALAAVLWRARGDARTAALLAAALAAVAVATFALRRYGRLDRATAAPVAGAAAVGVVGASLYAAIPRGGVVVVAAAVAAGGAAVAAYADWLGMEGDALATRAGSVARAAAVGLAGILAIYAWGVLVFVAVRAVVGGELSRPTVTVLSTLASGAGTVSAALLYLRWSDADLSYLDVRWPDRWGIGYAVAGVVAILGANVAISLAFRQAGIRTAQHAVIRTARAEPAVLLALIPLSYLVIAPGEELLFRNVVQKSLRETFDPVAGVVVASAVFAAVHFPAYLDAGSGLLSTLNTLFVVFLLALVLGAIYERTGNVVVPVLAHGTFNAVAFAATYAQLTGMVGG